MKIKLKAMLNHNWRTLLLLCTLITTSLEVCSTTTGVYVTTTREDRGIYYHIWNSSGTPSACAGTKWESHRELVSSATKLDDTSGGGFYKLECEDDNYNIIFLSGSTGSDDQTSDLTIDKNKWMRLGTGNTCDELMTESNLSSEGKVKFASSALSGISTKIPAVWNSTEKKFILQSACYTNSDNGGIHIYINESSNDYEYLYVNTYTSSGTYDIKWDPYSGNITFDIPTPPQTIVDVLSGTKIWFYSGTTSNWDINNIYLNNGSTDVVSNASGTVVAVSNYGVKTANLAAVNLAPAQYYLSNQAKSGWDGVQMGGTATAGRTYVLSSNDKNVCDGSGDRVCDLDGISITNLKFDNSSGDDTKTVSSGTDVSIFAQSGTTENPFGDALKMKYYVKKSGESTYYTECGWEASVANTTGTTGTLDTGNLEDGEYTVYALLMNATNAEEAVKASSTLTLTVVSCSTHPVATTGTATGIGLQGATLPITISSSASGTCTPTKVGVKLYTTSACTTEVTGYTFDEATWTTDQAYNIVVSGLSPGNTYYYRGYVKSSLGTNEDTSTSPVKYFMTTACTAPNVTAISNNSQTKCKGVAASQMVLTVEGGVTPYSYAWKQNGSKSTTGATGATESSNLASYTPPTSTAGTMYYYCVVSSATPCSSSQFSPSSDSDYATIVTNEVPSLSVVPTGTVKNFTPVTISSDVDDIQTWSSIPVANDESVYFYDKSTSSAKFKASVARGSNETYTITGTTSNDCSGSKTVTVTKDTGTCE